ncbi:hypothetical protein [uncultured Corynebacterium sp.]|uniref:hypothetical protein n=1 Tax=uncultured Corynebacterium sp. TaxID=159447 RepID=UPI00259AFC6D|nr:hypothetical protein [uncultured Corynebacterium sp.]
MLVVELTADGDAEVPEAAPAEPAAEFTAPTQPWPSFDDEPAQDLTPEDLLAEARSTSYSPHAIPASTTPLEPTPLPVERTNRATKVFKWSAIIAATSFFLFGMCLETFNPEAESFIAGLFRRAVPVRWAHLSGLGDLGAGEPAAAVERAHPTNLQSENGRAGIFLAGRIR